MYKLRLEGGVIRTSDNSIIYPRSSEWFSEYIPWFRSGGIVKPADDPPPLPPRDVTKEIKQKVKDITNFANTLRRDTYGNISAAEYATWSKKEELARKYLETGITSDAGILSLEAQKRGISLNQLVTKIINKANNFWNIETTISGNMSKHIDALSSLTTIEEVEAYDYSTGWVV